MKSLLLISLLAQLLVQMPEKGISAINFTLTGFDVVSAEINAENKLLEYNRVDNKTTHFIVYGGKDLLTNNDTITISGYHTAKAVKMTNVVGTTPEAIKVDIYNRYKRR